MDLRIVIIKVRVHSGVKMHSSFCISLFSGCKGASLLNEGIWLVRTVLSVYNFSRAS